MPNLRQLRQFGLIALVALPTVGWLWGAGTTLLTWLAVGGVVLGAIGFVAPAFLGPLFVGLSIVTMPLGMVIGELTMALVYFCVFVPIGLVFRLAGRDPMQRHVDRDRASYWEPKKKPASVSSYYRQS